jgi:tRNA(Ile)-lysidine synthase
LTRAPLALRRLAIWKAMTRAAGGRPVSFRHVDAALRLVEPIEGDAGDGPPSGSADRSINAPGHIVERVGSRLVLREAAVADAGRLAPPSLFRYRLPVPGEVTLLEAGYIVSAEAAVSGGDLDAIRAIASNGSAALVRSDSWTGPLEVRNRRPGDRFRPLGLDGQKKLQDFFVDRKVARHERDSVPLVVDGSDRIVWVAGHGIDEAFRVTDASQAVIMLKLRPA